MEGELISTIFNDLFIHKFPRVFVFTELEFADFDRWVLCALIRVAKDDLHSKIYGFVQNILDCGLDMNRPKAGQWSPISQLLTRSCQLSLIFTFLVCVLVAKVRARALFSVVSVVSVARLSNRALYECYSFISLNIPRVCPYLGLMIRQVHRDLEISCLP